MCGTLNSQKRRRTRVVGIFPNECPLLRLVTGVIIGISEEWETGKIHLQSESKKNTTELTVTRCDRQGFRALGAIYLRYRGLR